MTGARKRCEEIIRLREAYAMDSPEVAAMRDEAELIWHGMTESEQREIRKLDKGDAMPDDNAIRLVFGRDESEKTRWEKYMNGQWATTEELPLKGRFTIESLAMNAVLESEAERSRTLAKDEEVRTWARRGRPRAAAESARIAPAIAPAAPAQTWRDRPALL
jgi:hypothetical protein